MHGDNVLRIGGMVLDLLPQFGDMVVDGASDGKLVVSPDFVQQLRTVPPPKPAPGYKSTLR
jgi:hypothetical protein